MIYGILGPEYQDQAMKKLSNAVNGGSKKYRQVMIHRDFGLKSIAESPTYGEKFQKLIDKMQGKRS